MTHQLFDKMAKKYDSEDRIALANVIQKRVIEELQDVSGKTLLDYGSGTGLVGLGLHSLVKELILVDASEEMTAITAQKIKANNIENAHAFCGDLVKADIKFQADVILVSLVLLHVPDTHLILSQLFKHLKPDGQLIIVDFDLNERINDPRVHNGFNQEELKRQLEQVGFTSVSSDLFYTGDKLFMNQEASLVLTLAHK